MNICVYGASSSAIDGSYIAAAERLGTALAARGHGLIFGGGASGLMGAVARGVHSRGGPILGVAPSFFNVDGVLYPHCTEFLYTETMRERKQLMEDRADAFVMVPGGIGTLEEFFEILTLKQLGRHKKAIAVLNTNGYFDGMTALLDAAVREGFLAETCRTLYAGFAEPEPMLDYLEAYVPPEGGMETFKRV